jgi:predicted phage terminase large subunit-like protein
MTATATATLIDPSCPVPNIGGVPLWLSRKPLSKEQIDTLTVAHTRARAATYLADYADCVVLDDDAHPALHHRVICEHIDRLLDDEYDDLIINTPPGAAKSTYTSHALAAFYMGRFPRRNIILATHTADLSEKWSRKVRNTLADDRHAFVFPDSQLSKDSTAVSRWATRAGGEFLAAGVGASILGFRADIAIVDDPVSGFEQAQSDTQLAKIHSWFETDLITRLKPQGKIVMICQRLARNDLAGYMMDRHAATPTRRLRVLILPMIATGSTSTPDPLGRAPGERLWPEWYTLEMVEDAQRDDFKWRTLYQQNPPSDTGAWVAPEEILHRPTPHANTPRTLYGMTDLALSINKGDYTVHAVVAVDDNGDWDIVEVIRERVDPNESAKRLCSLASTYRPVEWLIDDDNAAKVFMQLVATQARTSSTAVPWKMLPMRGQDKETRAAALRGQFKRGKLYFPKDAPFARWLTSEILAFPNATGSGVDDGVDALSLLGRRMIAVRRPSATTPAHPPRPTIQQMTLDGLWDTLPKQSRRL